MNETRWAAFIWVSFFFFFQNSLAFLLPFAPPLLLIAVVFYALYEGPGFGAVIGCYAGLFLDVLGTGRLGPHMALYAASGALSGLAASAFFRESLLIRSALPPAFHYLTTLVMLTLFRWGTASERSVFIEAFLPGQLIVTAVLSPFLFRFLARHSLVKGSRSRW